MFCTSLCLARLTRNLASLLDHRQVAVAHLGRDAPASQPLGGHRQQLAQHPVSALRVVEPEERLDHRGLAGPRGAHAGVGLARRHGQVEAVEHGRRGDDHLVAQVAGAVPERDALEAHRPPQRVGQGGGAVDDRGLDRQPAEEAPGRGRPPPVQIDDFVAALIVQVSPPLWLKAVTRPREPPSCAQAASSR